MFFSAVFVRGAVAGLLAWSVVVVLFALYDAVAIRKERQALGVLAGSVGVTRAIDGVMAARTAFAVAVKRFEEARRRTEQQETNANPSDSARAGAVSVHTESPAVRELERAKDEAREELLAAQRIFETVRPGDGPNSPIDLWMGYGFSRTWQLGPIGFERVVLRLDHVVDPGCWVVWEVRRPKFGMGLAFERQRLAMFSVRATPHDLGALVGRAFDGAEFAVRPGFVPTRTWRRRHRDPEAKAANRALFSLHELNALLDGVPDSVRTTVERAFEVELGAPPADVESLPEGPGILSIHTAGPSGSLGVWTGPSPRRELRASSGHTAWQAQA